MGSAQMAGLAAGFFDSFEQIKSQYRVKKVYHLKMQGNIM